MSSLASLISEFNGLPLFSRRAVSAVVGACVGDAATRPTHWVYDRKVIENTIGNVNPEFWPTSLSPFYSLDTGMRSCYNDEAYSMLISLPHSPAVFDKQRTQDSLLKTFAPDSMYAEALDRRLKAYDPSQRLTEKVPIPGPWQQSSITAYLKAVGEGKVETGDAESKETDGFCLALPLIARLSASSAPVDKTEFVDTVRSAVTMLSSSETAIVHSAVRAEVLQALIRREVHDAPASLRVLVEDVVRSFDDDMIASELDAVLVQIPNPTTTTATTTTSTSTEIQPSTSATTSCWGEDNLSPAYLNAVELFGKACPDSGNFKSCILALLTCHSFREAIRRNILAGGCNCSRANFIGACFGAAYGIGGENGIPLEWIERTDKAAETLELALRLFASSEGAKAS